MASIIAQKVKHQQAGNIFDNICAIQTRIEIAKQSQVTQRERDNMESLVGELGVELERSRNCKSRKQVRRMFANRFDCTAQKL
jgi:hypothetical protein